MRIYPHLVLVALPLWLMAAPPLAYASDPSLMEMLNTQKAAIDTIWVLMAAFLVFFMQAGFAMVEAGFTRAKNAGNIVLKNLMDFCMASLMYWMAGFALMFGVDWKGLIGSNGFFLSGNLAHLELGIPLLAFWLFQAMFAGTTATIVSGAVAERTKFSSYLIFSALITLFIYPVIGHWTWGGGWLGKMGFTDFAGSTVVHSVGAWAALGGLLVIGPRLGRFNQSKSKAVTGHSITMAALGVFILWFGWYGFNAGSTLSGTDPIIASIAATTTLGAAAGAMTALFVVYSLTRKWKVDMALNGALSGLVAITAPTAFVTPAAAVIIGCVGGLVMVPACRLLEKLKIDDAVGAIPVHGVAGAWGTLSVGIFHQELGWLYGGGLKLLGIQALGVTAVFLYTLPASWLVFKTIDMIFGLKVSRQQEKTGLDIEEHGVKAYPEFSPHFN